MMIDKIYNTESSLINFSSYKRASHKVHIEKGSNKMGTGIKVLGKQTINEIKFTRI